MELGAKMFRPRYVWRPTSEGLAKSRPWLARSVARMFSVLVVAAVLVALVDILLVTREMKNEVGPTTRYSSWKY